MRMTRPMISPPIKGRANRVNSRAAAMFPFSLPELNTFFQARIRTMTRKVTPKVQMGKPQGDETARLKVRRGKDHGGHGPQTEQQAHEEIAPVGHEKLLAIFLFDGLPEFADTPGQSAVVLLVQLDLVGPLEKMLGDLFLAGGKIGGDFSGAVKSVVPSSSVMVRYFFTAMSIRATVAAFWSRPILEMNLTAAGDILAGGSNRGIMVPLRGSLPTTNQKKR